MVGEEVLIGEGMLLDMGEGRQSSQGLDKNKREGGGGGYSHKEEVERRVLRRRVLM